MREKNKVVILGGGFSGLAAAYFLSQKNHKVTIIEKENQLGGLAAGFKKEDWDFFLEKTVHHLFANDKDILDFAKKTGFGGIFFKKPETASLYEISNSKFLDSKQLSKDKKTKDNFKIFPLDTPFDLLRFPLLPFIDRVRAGAVLAFLKISHFLPFLEKQTAERFLKKTMGKKAYKVLFGELFRKKFGKYAGNILASFIWARVKKRTKKLGYIEGGFQNFINHLEKKLIENNVEIFKGKEIEKVEKRGEKFIINGEIYDIVVSTLPTPVLVKTTKQIFPKKFIESLQKIKFSNSISLVVETDKPVLKNTYWTNILVQDIPIMGLFQHTNFVNKKNYGGKNILYCGWYVNPEDRLWKMKDKEILNYVLPYLKKISNFKFQISNFSVFRAAYAQPIFDKEFLSNKPDFFTPIKNFFIANLDMTYPYDRGTNYAVKLGKKVVEIV